MAVKNDSLLYIIMSEIFGIWYFTGSLLLKRCFDNNYTILDGNITLWFLLFMLLHFSIIGLVVIQMYVLINLSQKFIYVCCNWSRFTIFMGFCWLFNQIIIPLFVSLWPPSCRCDACIHLVPFQEIFLLIFSSQTIMLFIIQFFPTIIAVTHCYVYNVMIV